MIRPACSSTRVRIVSRITRVTAAENPVPGPVRPAGSAISSGPATPRPETLPSSGPFTSQASGSRPKDRTRSRTATVMPISSAVAFRTVPAPPMWNPERKQMNTI